MMRGQSKRTDRHSGLFLDIFHLVTGILIVVMGLLAFIQPQRYEILFPLVFLAGAALNGVTGFFELKIKGRSKKRKRSGMFHMVITVFLLVVSVLSAVSIWR